MRSCRRATVRPFLPKVWPRGPLALVGARRPGEGDRLDGRGGHRVALGLGEKAAAGSGLAKVPALGHVGDQQVEMEMIVMVAVGTRTEHGVELCAAASERLLQKGLLPPAAAPPAFDHGDLRAVRELESGNVDGVAVSVLGQRPAMPAVTATAAVRRDLLDLCLLYT